MAATVTRLKGVGVDSPIVARANCLAAGLPLIGEANPVAEIYLCHYSDNAEIKQFAANGGQCNWLDGIACKHNKISSLTHINNVPRINSLYVVRLGLPRQPPEVGNGCITMMCNKFGAYEYALDTIVKEGEFARIGLVYCRVTQSFA